MAETQIIQIGDQSLSIEVSPVTLIFQSAHSAMGPDIRYTEPKRVVLDMEATLHHARRVKNLHREFEAAWRLFMENTTPHREVDYPVTPDRIREMGSGSLHLMGLIDMSLKFSDMGVPVVWKHPESCMHPGWQVALGDLVMWLSRRQSGPGNSTATADPRP